MLTQEWINLVVTELSTTFLKMLDPVKARILNLWGKEFPYSTAFYISRENAGSA
jgi:hypothetical protein